MTHILLPDPALIILSYKYLLASLILSGASLSLYGAIKERTQSGFVLL